MPRNINGSKEQMMAHRNALLASTDWICRRHEDQERRLIGTTLTEHQFNDFLDYRQALRDWPVSGDVSEPLPEKPDWMVSNTAQNSVS